MERAAFINAWEIDRQIGFMTAYYADHLDCPRAFLASGLRQRLDNPLFPGFIGDEDTR